jgi:hypothetical protein
LWHLEGRSCDAVRLSISALAERCGYGHRNRVIYLRLPPIILILVQPKNVAADQLLPTSPYWQQLAAGPLRARGNAIIAWSAAQFSRCLAGR